eukprot:GHVS01012460.1.p1 GENE.GHVS01012460.1~~GHVS01012460.1.p1  ORF type:complete len:184 (+),score=18.69 GHVS01012460.1:246-797(+)
MSMFPAVMTKLSSAAVFLPLLLVVLWSLCFMLSVNAGKDTAESLFVEAETYLKDSPKLKLFSRAHSFMVNTDAGTPVALKDLKDGAKHDLEDMLKKRFGSQVKLADVEFDVAAPAGNVDDNTGGGNEMAREHVVNVTVEIKNESKILKISEIERQRSIESSCGTRKRALPCIPRPPPFAQLNI